jgi:hypothetical protein
MPVLYLAVIVLGLILGIILRMNNAGMGFEIFLYTMGAQTSKLIIGVWLFMLAIMLAVTLAMIVQRYRNNLLKDEGYLMFTLPAPSWFLIASKAVAALGMFLLSVLACTVSVLVAMAVIVPGGFFTALSAIFEVFSDYLAETGNLASLPLICLWALIASVQQLCLVYAVITAAQLLPRFRGIAGFAVYTVVMLLESRLTQAITKAFAESPVPKMTVICAAALALVVLYFWLSGWLLKRTLNLE